MIAQTEVLAQLAEEAAELAQAALKLRRTLNNDNPTPVSYSEAMDSLKEEIADVWCCVGMTGLDTMDALTEIAEMAKYKRERWMKRLGEVQGVQ